MRKTADQSADHRTKAEPPFGRADLVQPDHKEIERLAYALWESHGGGDGSDVWDWLTAEYMLMAEDWLTAEYMLMAERRESTTGATTQTGTMTAEA